MVGKSELIADNKAKAERPSQMQDMIAPKETEEIKKETEEGIINLTTTRARERKRQQLMVEARKRARAKMEPHCETCITIDFNDAVKVIEDRKHETDKTVRIPVIKTEDYWGIDKFDKVGENKTRRRDGTRIEIVQSTEWKCKRRGHTVIVASDPEYEHL